MYIYIYIEREMRIYIYIERERERDIDMYTYTCVYTDVHMYACTRLGREVRDVRQHEEYIM